MGTEPTYTIIPNSVIESGIYSNLNGSESKVYVALCKRYNFKERMAWPSLKTMAKDTGLSSKHVGKAINILCAKGLVHKIKKSSLEKGFERNSYFLPHHVTFQIEQLEFDLTQPKNKGKFKTISTELDELRKLERYLLKEIQTFIGATSKIGVATPKIGVGSPEKSEATTKTTDGVPQEGHTNNTIINTTINITKNVKDNENISTDFRYPKSHKRSLSIRASQHISEIDTLVRIKHEGLVQKLAEDLNDQKSIPFFRQLVTKFGNHEDSIYKCLSLTRETQELSGINKSRGAVFTDHVKREAEKLGIEL